jgi:hypothetical protein
MEARTQGARGQTRNGTACAARAPRPKRTKISAKTLAEAGAQDLRDFYARVIAEVRVYPRSNGERLMMRWQGAEQCFPVPEFDSTLPPEALVA